MPPQALISACPTVFNDYCTILVILPEHFVNAKDGLQVDAPWAQLEQQIQFLAWN